MMQIKSWRVLPAIISTAILSFCGVLFETSMNVTFPELMQVFHVPATSIQWATTGNLLAVSIVVPLSAYLIRNFSERQVFILANALFIAGVTTDALANQLPTLLLGRVLQGMGTGIALPLLFHIILHQVALEKRGLYMGIATMTTSLAPAIGPTYGGVVLATLGWKMIFVLLLPVLLVSCLVGLKAIPSRLVQKNETLNVPAFISLGIGLAFLLLTIEKLSLLLACVALLGFVGFYYFNRKQPLLKLTVFNNKAFLILLYGVLAYQMVPLATSYVLPNYLQLGLGQNSVQAGLFMFPGAILASALYPFSGHLLDKIGSFKPIMLGLGLTLLGLFSMSLLIMTRSVWGLLLTDLLVKMGMGFGLSNMVTTSLSQLKEHEFADGNSILNTFQQFAGAFAVAISSQLFALAQVHHPEMGARLGGRNALYVILFAVFVALLGLMRVKRARAIS